MFLPSARPGDASTVTAVNNLSTPRRHGTARPATARPASAHSASAALSPLGMAKPGPFGSASPTRTARAKSDASSLVIAAALEQQALGLNRRLLKQSEQKRFRTDGPPMSRSPRTDAREPELLTKLLIYVGSEMGALGGASCLTVEQR